jgi:hypothetical protein
MNLVPRRLLAIAIPAAVGATVATVMLVGAHGSTVPQATTHIVQRADATATATPSATDVATPTAMPTDPPTAAPTARPSLIACGNGTYAEFACKRDLPTATPVPTPAPKPCPGFPGFFEPCHPAGTVDLGSGLWTVA